MTYPRTASSLISQRVNLPFGNLTASQLAAGTPFNIHELIEGLKKKHIDGNLYLQHFYVRRPFMIKFT